MTFIDESLFLTTFGREFCMALASDPNFAIDDELSAQDCYSVYTETLGRPPTLEDLIELRDSDFVDLAAGFNNFFEISSVKPGVLVQARDAVLRQWQP